ncbi:MAG: FTR1 family protein [Chloroflexota bacterium]
MRLILTTLIILLPTISLLLEPQTGTSVTVAQAAPPWELKEVLDDALFEGQKLLLRGDVDAAVGAVEETVGLFAGFTSAYPSFSKEARDAAEGAIGLARDGTAQGNANQLAVAKGQLHTAMLWGSYQATLDAIQNSDFEPARHWLLLRDFRPSTRFDRPGADATLALTELESGHTDIGVALARVQADLLDTYQGKLLESLEKVSESSQFFSRRSESAGLAQGYWRILVTSFAEQVGVEAAQNVDEQFEALANATMTEDEPAIHRNIATIREHIQNFRAAQLSMDELVRRTGQLIRYISLVPIEYDRGVEGGEIFLAFEIQEAVTFMRGAQAAFADLRPALYADNPELVETVQSQLDRIQHHLGQANRQEAVIPVAEMKAQTNALNDNLATLIPEEWNQLDPDADFDVIAAVLDQVEAAVDTGQYNMAESAHLEAYAVFDFGPEPRLLAFAPELVARIDGLFWQGFNGERGLAEALASKESAKTIRDIRANLDASLTEAQRTLGDLPSAPGAIITNAAIIVFREGLEAVVILAALTASFVGGMVHYRRYIGIGALLAFVATFATGVAMQELLSSFMRFGERLEAVISLVAIGVILLITNWFFHKAYWKDHMKGMHEQKSGIVKGSEAGRNLGLVMLGFTSIYREGFETALFLQALLLDAGPAIVLQGVALGLVVVGAAGVATFLLQRRLPFMKMFILTAILIGAVLLTMVGNTVHIMQKVGWMSITPFRLFDIPYWMGLWLGLFPTWEGIGWQVAAAVFVIGSYYLAEAQTDRRRRQMQTAAAVQG